MKLPEISKHGQNAFLSVLDGTATPENTIFLFTANGTDKLEERFLSRCRKLKFEPPTVREVSDFLARVWAAEISAPAIDFEAIAKEADGNVRSALMELEGELLMVANEEPAAANPVPVFLPAPPAQRETALSDLKAELARLTRAAA